MQDLKRAGRPDDAVIQPVWSKSKASLKGVVPLISCLHSLGMPRGDPPPIVSLFSLRFALSDRGERCCRVRVADGAGGEQPAPRAERDGTAHQEAHTALRGLRRLCIAARGPGSETHSLPALPVTSAPSRRAEISADYHTCCLAVPRLFVRARVGLALIGGSARGFYESSRKITTTTPRAATAPTSHPLLAVGAGLRQRDLGRDQLMCERSCVLRARDGDYPVRGACHAHARHVRVDAMSRTHAQHSWTRAPLGKCVVRL